MVMFNWCCFCFCNCRCHNMGFPCERARHKTKQRDKKLIVKQQQLLLQQPPIVEQISAETKQTTRSSSTASSTTVVVVRLQALTTTTTSQRDRHTRIGDVVTSGLAQLISFNPWHKSQAILSRQSFVCQSVCVYATLVALLYLSTPIVSAASTADGSTDNTNHPM